MDTEKANEFCSFLLEAIHLFEAVYDKREFEFPDMQAKMEYFTREEFDRHFDEFEDELKFNIMEYGDLAFIVDYIQVTLTGFHNWEGFPCTLNQEILRNKHEVPFLLTLKKNIEFYEYLISEIFSGLYNEGDSYVRTLFDLVMAHVDHPDMIDGANNPPWNIKFHFSKIKEECANETLDTIGKISLIHNRLYDFRQWQLRNDEEIRTTVGNRVKVKYKYSDEYYPNFQQLCKIELERLETQLELEKKALTHKAIEQNPVVIQGAEPSFLTWTASDTDLLELIAALHKSDCVKRVDGKPLTRKDLVAYFQHIFNIEIKDVEGKLNRATSRKKNMTPFLDSLKAAFTSYAEEKEEKLQGRR